MTHRALPPAAARVGDSHRCHGKEPAPHVGGPILEPGCPTVFIEDESAARVGDEAWCEAGSFDVIVTGEATVLIGGKPAARKGDRTDGGVITGGSFTVKIGRVRARRRRR